MKVKYSTITLEKGVERFKLEGVDICCDGMKEAWGADRIGFGDESFDDFKKETSVCQIAFKWSEGGCYVGDIDYYDEQIFFCPFCGVRLLLEEVGKFKRVETLVKYIEEISRQRIEVKDIPI